MAKSAVTAITVKPPNFGRVEFTIAGDSPLVINKFSEKAKLMMMEKHKAGSSGKKGTAKQARDFEADCAAAAHVSREGWHGIAAPAFRSALISACRLVGFAMTRAKLSLFIEAEGTDRDDGTQLVRITKGEPEMKVSYVKNESGVADLRARPWWMPGWEARVVVRFDADQFTETDVVNLMLRAGQQVGVGAGRPDSSNSGGQGWGTFTVAAATMIRQGEE